MLILSIVLFAKAEDGLGQADQHDCVSDDGVVLPQLSSVFQSRMVFQRDQPITVWGFGAAAASGAISISLGNETKSWLCPFQQNTTMASTAHSHCETVSANCRTTLAHSTQHTHTHTHTHTTHH